METTLYLQIESQLNLNQNLFDVFRTKLLFTLIDIFDQYGENSEYYLEGLAIKKLLLINQNFLKKYEEKKQDKFIHSEQKICILDAIQKIFQKIQNKNVVKDLLSKRIIYDYEKFVTSEFDMENIRKSIVNSIVLKSQSTQENFKFIGQLISHISIENNTKTQKITNKNPKINVFEFQFSKVIKNFTASKALDYSLHKKTKIYKPKLFDQILAKYLRIQIKKNISELSMNTYVEQLLTDFQINLNSKNKIDKQLQIPLKFGSFGKLGDRLFTKKNQIEEDILDYQTKSKINTFKNLSIIQMIESFCLIVDSKSSLNDFKAFEIDKLIVHLVELRHDLGNLLNDKLGNNFLDFSKMTLDSPPIAKITKLLKKLTKDKKNTFSNFIG